MTGGGKTAPRECFHPMDRVSARDGIAVCHMCGTERLLHELWPMGANKSVRESIVNRENGMFGKGKCRHEKINSHIDTGDLVCDECGVVIKKDVPVAKVTSLPEKETTRGEYLVGLDFNPSGKPEVDEAKRKAAALLDQMDELFQNGTDDQARCAVNAMNAIELGCMWAVKALTRK